MSTEQRRNWIMRQYVDIGLFIARQDGPQHAATASSAATFTMYGVRVVAGVGGDGEMEKLMAELQMEREKIAMELEKMRQEMELSWQKMQQEMAMKQEQHAMDQQIKQANAQQDMALKEQQAEQQAEAQRVAALRQESATNQPTNQE